jgi:hypothetical protein
MIAIHGLDNSVEYLLRILIDALDIEGREGKTLTTVELASLAGEVDKFLRKHHDLALPYLTEVKKLRQLRNLVQHGMVDPATEMPHLRTIVDRFYRFVFASIFGLDATTLRLSALVRAESVRTFLQEAESAIEAEEYLVSVVACRDAFQNAYYERRRYSNLRLNTIPVLLEAGASETQYFFKAVAEELELLRLDVDARLYDRLKKYIDHIPHDLRADRSGGMVMQRPWEKRDAEFCYHFVSQTILQWESADLDPIYEIDTSDLPAWYESIGEVDLPDGAHHTMFWFDDSRGSRLEVLVGDTELKEKIENLQIGSKYSHSTEIVENGEVRTRILNRIRLKAVLTQLLTHNPVRWEISIEYEAIPLTWYREDLESGEIIRQTPSINSASVEQLVTVYPDVISREIAEGVVAHREKHGPFITKEDVEHVPGITEDQVNWLCSFTRSDPSTPTFPKETPGAHKSMSA